MSSQAQGAVGAETMTAGQSLDLRDLHAANIARQAEWCPEQVPDLSFRGNELGGECGEAQNVIKKLERERQGWRGSRATKNDLADELADVVICADLCAVTADIDLGAAVRRKFNATSEKQGLSVFLPSDPAALAIPRTDSDERTAGGWRKVMRDLIAEHDKNVCPHEETHRGGAIWTICDHCGRKWADDEGGFQPYEEPAAVTAAWALLKCEDVSTPAPSSPGVPDRENLVRLILDAASMYTRRNGDITDVKGMAYRIANTLIEAQPRLLLTAPVTSPGVPDSVRALAKRWAETIRNSQRQAGKKEWISLHDTEANEITKLLDSISTHPAGQGTGQGAVAELCDRLDRLNTVTEPQACAEAMDEARLVILRLTAPDSTRTGQVEADLVETVARAIFEADEDLNDESEDELRAEGNHVAADCLAGPRARWDDPKNAPVLDAFRYRAKKAIEAARPAAPEAQGAWMSKAADDVLAERRRQVEAEGWTPEHDDGHRRGELGYAAACYAAELDLWTGYEQADRKGRPTLIGANRVWPWSGWWKPADRRRNLVKAGALILAEIERLDRLPAPPSSGQEG